MENQAEKRPLNLAQLLRIPFQALVTELHERLEKVGYGDIRPTHTIIFALVGTEGIRLTDLAERAQLTKQLVNYLVTAMEERNYVERIPDPEDGRAKLVRLTEKGQAAAAAGRSIIQSIEQEWADLVGKDAMSDIRTNLEQLVKAVRHDPGE
ncbi:MAG TPA: MarR family transcriptional regulator [Chloroflexia bacterium]|nr:MarR family transcriptional regulator [Chloroflexia bacterium]